MINENIVKSEPLISVIVPVFNAQLYLKDAIDSILNQSLSDFELIIINDGSTDNSENVILSYKDARIVYIKNEQNLRLVETLNIAIEKARGKYIARMDADDISLPNRFEGQLKYLKDTGADLVGSSIMIFGDNVKKRKQIYPCSRFDIEYCMIWFCAVAHPTVFSKAEVLKANLYGKEHKLGEDYGLWTNLILKKYKILNTSECFLNYRHSSTQYTAIDKNPLSAYTLKISKEYSKLKFGEEGLYLNDMFFDTQSSLSVHGLVNLLKFNQQFAIKNNVSTNWISDINCRFINKYAISKRTMIYLIPMLFILGIKFNLRVYLSIFKQKVFN